jgi:undecaprenyl-diphosphatase
MTDMMMQWWHALILGIIEGATEFLPISSTFHLLFGERLLGLANSDFNDMFAVAIQMAAVIPLLMMFWREWFQDRKVILLTLVAFIPTSVLALLGYKIIKQVFFANDWLMLSVFILVGIGFLVLEQVIKRGHLQLPLGLDKFTWQQAALIGAVQALAVLPGVSRAGAVMVGMMFLGYKRDAAARFSFMLAVPTLMAASLYDLYKMRAVVLSNFSTNALLLLIGGAAAFVSAWLVVRWFLGFVRTHNLNTFGWYRLIIGAGALVWLLLR